jgi:hypothetical protein
MTQFESEILQHMKAKVSPFLASEIGDWVLSDGLFRSIIDGGVTQGKSAKEIADDILSVRGSSAHGQQAD